MTFEHDEIVLFHQATQVSLHWETHPLVLSGTETLTFWDSIRQACPVLIGVEVAP
jgi:hypothetical protein